MKAATYFNDPVKLLEASEELGMAMFGIDVAKLSIRTVADQRLVDGCGSPGQEEDWRTRAAGRF